MNKRREVRIDNSIARVLECHDSPELVGESIACEIIDFSCHGMRLRTHHALVSTTMLNITIGIDDMAEGYQLRGEILWTEIHENECHLGVLFSYEDNTDLDAWTNLVRGMQDADRALAL